MVIPLFTYKLRLTVIYMPQFTNNIDNNTTQIKQFNRLDIIKCYGKNYSEKTKPRMCLANTTIVTNHSQLEKSL